MQDDTESQYIRAAGGNGHQLPAVETVYRTTRIIFDYGVDALRGQGTRLFEVHHLEGNVKVRELVMIKDVWVDDDQERESTILNHLLDKPDDEDRELVKRYFLTVLSVAMAIADVFRKKCN